MPPVDSSGKDVTTAATAERLVSTSIRVNSVTIKAKGTNTGNMFIGESDVDNTKAPLPARDAIVLNSGTPEMTFDLKDIYVDASVNGEGVWFWYVQL